MGGGSEADGASRRMRVAFLSPRLAEDGAVGGAETLLFNLATLAAGAGFDVEFLTTCAKNHFTWANELPAGESVRQGVRVRRFPVNPDRDGALFMSLQSRISEGAALSPAEEVAWLANNVNSDAMMEYASRGGFDRIVTGPSLFGLALTAARLFPDRTVLVPCLHDEPFARVPAVAKMFGAARGFCFNTESERRLAASLYGAGVADGSRPSEVVGFALDDFESSAARGRELAGTESPYLLFCGRREPLKGTPLLVDYWAAFRRSFPGTDLKFVFTGFGDIERPDGLGDGIVDLGFVSEQDKHDLMAGALAFCHASVNESLGIVLLESWLARRPVLVLSSGTVLTAQTKASGGGLWFSNCPEFLEEVSLLLERPDLAAALGEAGRRWTLASYSRESVARRLAALLSR